MNLRTFVATALSATLAAGILVVAPASHAGFIEYTADLSGPAESPSNASLATGFAEIDVDTTAHTLEVTITFSGLLGPTTVSHIHCCTLLPGTGIAGVATQLPTFAGFPMGVTSGSYDHTFDLTLASTYNPAFVTASGGTVPDAEATLIAGLSVDECVPQYSLYLQPRWGDPRLPRTTTGS